MAYRKKYKKKKFKKPEDVLARMLVALRLNCTFDTSHHTEGKCQDCKRALDRLLKVLKWSKRFNFD